MKLGGGTVGRQMHGDTTIGGKYILTNDLQHNYTEERAAHNQKAQTLGPSTSKFVWMLCMKNYCHIDQVESKKCGTLNH
jgi:hypothetical protein